MPHATTKHLSKGPIRPVNILDLPVDILHLIFEEFQYFNMITNDKINWCWNWCIEDSNIYRTAIQNLRLVCCLFCEIASPLLLPTMRVRLDQLSLDIVKGVAKNPLLARGVRGIEVLLDYCPERLATDLGRFSEQRSKELDEFSSTCSYYAETWFLRGCDVDDESVCPQPYSVYAEAMDNYADITNAWEEYLVDPTAEATEDAIEFEYQQLLVQSFKCYQRKHEEQLQLIEDGAFVTTLATGIAQIANSCSLRLSNQTYCNPTRWEPTVVLRDKKELARFMVTPHDWQTIEELGSELPPAKILTELPVAIYKAGASLRELRISCFPATANSYSSIWSDGYNQLNLDEFRAACQHLKVFKIGDGSMNHLPVRYDYLSKDDQIPFNRYLCAALSGHCLKNVVLNLHAFKINNGRRGSQSRNGYHHVGSVLCQIKWPWVKHVTICSIEIQQHELETFCKGLSYNLDRIFLFSIHLLDGSWANILDILREKVRSRHLDGQCVINFRSLTGGEFGKLNKGEQQDVVANESSGWWNLSGVEEEQLVVIQSQKYVAGIGGLVNPLNEIM